MWWLCPTGESYFCWGREGPSSGVQADWQFNARALSRGGVRPCASVLEYLLGHPSVSGGLWDLPQQILLQVVTGITSVLSPGIPPLQIWELSNLSTLSLQQIFNSVFNFFFLQLFLWRFLPLSLHWVCLCVWRALWFLCCIVGLGATDYSAQGLF